MEDKCKEVASDLAEVHKLQRLHKLSITEIIHDYLKICRTCTNTWGRYCHGKLSGDPPSQKHLEAL